METPPLLTVITVTYQAEALISRTARSILNQTAWPSMEWIVIDGHSQDATVRLAQQEAVACGKAVRILSESDRGIYDAMNKGVALAQGEWILFMNAGDVFVSGETVEACDLDHQTADLVYGHCLQIYPSGKEHLTRCLPLAATWKHMPCSHQSLFSRRRLLQRFPFAWQWKVAADHHFLAQCLAAGMVENSLNFPIAKVQLERYQLRQILDGQRQKQQAVVAAGAPQGIIFHYWRQTFGLILKHGLKKLIPADWGRSLFQR